MPLDITASLDLALRHLRDPLKVIRIWADGICINQQVSQMGLIYEYATHTIIFLGLATAESDIFMRIVNSLENIGGPRKPRYGYDTSHERDWQLRKVLPTLRELYPWFTRVWVLQELVLSANPWLQCGQLRCRWTNFTSCIPRKLTSSIVDGMEYLWGMEEPRVTRLREKHTEWPSRTPQISFETAAGALLKTLHSRRGLGATDPRDFIFAQLGMMNHIIQEAITVDYTKNYLILFTDIARQILAWIPSLDILQLVGVLNPTSLTDGLPSWVPDWTKTIKRLWPHSSVIGWEESIPKTQPDSCYRLLHSDSNLLVVPVKFVGTVESIIPTTTLRDALVTSKANNKTSIKLEDSDPATSSLSVADSKFQEIMLYFYSILLERSLGETKKDVVIDPKGKDSPDLPSSVLSMLRGAIREIQGIRDFVFFKFPPPEDNDDLGAVNLHNFLETMRRIAGKLPYTWTDSRLPPVIALLSTGSLTVIPNNARIGDHFFIDLSAGVTYSNIHRVTSILLRRDDGFCMSDKDSAALAQLVMQSETKEGRYLPSIEAAGPFRLLAREQFFGAPSLEWVKELYFGMEIPEKGTEVVLLS